MKLKPINDKIVVRPTKKEDEHVSEGGIILPDTISDGSLSEGTVVSVGEGMYSANGTLIPVVVEEGDTILYGKHAGVGEYKLDGETLIIMSTNEVLSVLEGNE